LSETLLACSGVTKRFGGLAALDEVDCDIYQDEILGLIGPNGAGKTTLFNCIAGYHAPTSGTITFKGENITDLKPYETCKRGIGRTFQIPRPFRKLTVLGNVVCPRMFGKANVKTPEIAKIDAMEYLELTGLSDKADVLADEITYPDMKRLGLAQALAADPELLMLDEPIAGLNPTEVEETMALIRRVHDETGITVLLIEHIMRAIMGLADRIIVLNYGKKIATGSPEEIIKNEEVVKAYLGERY
jgi:branched-chain amino acid transport system ATP-binding protein